MRKRGYDVINYIDDVIGFGTVSTANPAFQCLYQLFENLGFEISKTKLVAPTTKVTCLGVSINTEDFTVSVPSEKLQNISHLCQKWASKNGDQETTSIFIGQFTLHFKMCKTITFLPKSHVGITSSPFRSRKNTING